MGAFFGMMGSRFGSGRFVTWSVIVLVVALVLSAASATGARRSPRDAACTSGASSVTAAVVNGRIVATTPVVTGCIPR